MIINVWIQKTRQRRIKLLGLSDAGFPAHEMLVADVTLREIKPN